MKKNFVFNGFGFHAAVSLGSWKNYIQTREFCKPGKLGISNSCIGPVERQFFSVGWSTRFEVPVNNKTEINHEQYDHNIVNE